MPADLEDLERLARSFFEDGSPPKLGKDGFKEIGKRFGEWRKAAQPAVILALIEERKRLLAGLTEAQARRICEALGADPDLRVAWEAPGPLAPDGTPAGIVCSDDPAWRIVQKAARAAIAAGEIKPEGGNAS